MHIEIGDQLPSFTKAITNELMLRYGALSDDRSSFHVNPELAAETPYKMPIVQGVLTEAFAARLLSDWLPDPRVWFAGSTMTTKFTGPVVAGDTITFSGIVVQAEEGDGRRQIVCDVTAVNQRGETVLVAEASFAL